MTLRASVFSVMLLAVTGLAAADVVPIGEFVGGMYEGFENLYPPGTYPGPMLIFNGQASVDDAMIHIVPIATVWQGPAGIVYPYNGNLFSGVPVGALLFQFFTPVMDFGGYFTTVSTMAGGTVTFRDPQGGLIVTLPMALNPLEWTWQGWHSDTPIGSIEITAYSVPGISALCDDLHANVIPEPTALILLTSGGMLTWRRR